MEEVDISNSFFTRTMQLSTSKLLVFLLACTWASWCGGVEPLSDLKQEFAAPPTSARPWVYWMIMDGNLSREGITADLESMKKAGIGGVIIMEVSVGIPRGPVAFMSDRWCDLFRHAVEEAERLGLEITLNAGPGWTGSGGPWVKAEQSMQHLVAGEVAVKGPSRFDAVLPLPEPRTPYFGSAGLPAEMVQSRRDFYADVAVLAVRTTHGVRRLEDIDEKALYVREPYTSKPGVKPFLPEPASSALSPGEAVIQPSDIVDLTARLQPGGRLTWDVPAGDWTILRFGRRTTGANTRPAPEPGLGWECDKFDSAALDAHFEVFVGKLLSTIGPRPAHRSTGWTMLHIDSWEMGAQNWTAKFAAEFERRRGYNPLPYLPVMTGRVVESVETSERFLWDLRQTAQELVISEHAEHLKELGRRYGFGLSIEPYDMNPTADMTLGAVADVPMCEFWSQGHGFNATFSCVEASSVAHTRGRPIVAAEAFTAAASEAWQLFPGAMKNQGDWAFCTGINRLVFHRFAHQPWLDRRPGMTMGPYGVHWERTQTWWPMAGAYHQYLARCQHLLRQGRPVADVCYLAPEGAPHVFRPPSSALEGTWGDRRAYNFDGCAPETLLTCAMVENGRIVLGSGSSYPLLVLPARDTITPPLLRKLASLVESGATMVGQPPARSPSLCDYPQCDREVQALANRLWGDQGDAPQIVRRKVGLGQVICGGELRRGGAPAGDVTHAINKATWIWYPHGDPAAAAEPGQRFFRRTLHVESDKRVLSARMEMTADNSFRLWVNGRLALEGDDFHVVFHADIASLLRPGKNVLAVAASNGADRPNPAGLIGSLRLVYRDGSTEDISTDRQWLAAEAVDGDDWRNAVDAGETWVAVRRTWPVHDEPMAT